MSIEFIISVYNRFDNLTCLLNSLICQTDKEWTATVVVDNPDAIFPTKDDIRINYEVMPVRYNDFGHTPRETAKQKSRADYVIMTNDDNYYTPNLVKEVKEAASFKPGLIYWDMIHSHYDYQYFKCSPHTHQIDMGAFATRTDIAKQIKLGRNFAADGDYIEEFNRRFPREVKTKIHKVLFVHN